MGQWLREDAATRLTLGYNFVDVSNLYQYYTLVSNLNYDIQPNTRKSITIDRFGIDLFVPDADSSFQEILNQNRILAEGFKKQLFTGFLFRNYLYQSKSDGSLRSGLFEWIHNVELSGFEVFLLNSLVNKFEDRHLAFGFGPISEGDDTRITFSHFAKAEVDFRYKKDIGRQMVLATKINMGIVHPFGGYTKQVPYLKQFHVGGAVSNRAWRIRQLGPGSYIDPTVDPDSRVPFFQTGDFKIDLSLEVQFPLFWLFDSAIFLDAANVWSLREGDPRDGAGLTWDFYKELAIGYGVGVRLDLDFFLLRFDMGYKLHNPYPVEYEPGKSSRWLVNELKKFPGGLEPQFAVGLPF